MPAMQRTAPATGARARVTLTRLDPWSVMKTVFLFSIAAAVGVITLVYLAWLMLSGSGLFDSVNAALSQLVPSAGSVSPRIQDYVDTQKVVGATALVAAIGVVVVTATSTLGCFLYNVAATLLGGVDITLEP